MNWDSLQQVLRILLYAIGGYFLGDAVTEGEAFRAAVGGVLAVGSFLWWLVWERNRPGAMSVVGVIIFAGAVYLGHVGTSAIVPGALLTMMVLLWLIAHWWERRRA